MRKNKLSPRTPETPATPDGARAPRGKRRAKSPRDSPRDSPRNHRELAQAIFAECDPITVGRELLESGSERGGTVKARVWETLVEFLLGKPAAAASAASGANVRIVWDLPAPPHEANKS